MSFISFPARFCAHGISLAVCLGRGYADFLQCNSCDVMTGSAVGTFVSIVASNEKHARLVLAESPIGFASSCRLVSSK